MADAEPHDVEERIRLLLDAGDCGGAATTAIRGYGPQILSYLRAVLRDEDAAAEGFSQFAEGLWKGIGDFRRESSVLTWSYRIAWGAVRHLRRDPFQRRGRRLNTSEWSRLAVDVRQSTVPYRRTGTRDAVARLRASLDEDEQTLLILRVDRNLAWKDVAQVMGEQGAPVDEPALRKRFERLKSKLKKLAEAEGLLAGR